MRADRRARLARSILHTSIGITLTWYFLRRSILRFSERTTQSVLVETNLVRMLRYTLGK